MAAVQPAHAKVQVDALPVLLRQFQVHRGCQAAELLLSQWLKQTAQTPRLLSTVKILQPVSR